jgi:hypothetical protein
MLMLAEHANCAGLIFINPRRESEVIFRLVPRVPGANPLDVLDHPAS